MFHSVQALFIGVLVSLHLAAPVQSTHVKQPVQIKQTSQVQGVQTHKIITTPTVLPTHGIVPKISSAPNVQPVRAKKQYGAWYWQPALGRSQMWIGTDLSGKDIFVDSLPT